MPRILQLYEYAKYLGTNHIAQLPVKLHATRILPRQVSPYATAMDREKLAKMQQSVRIGQ